MAGLQRIISLMLLPIFTRIFSVDEYGTIDIIATFTTLLSVTGAFALPSAISRYYSHSLNGKTLDRGKLFSSVLSFSILGNALLCALVFLFADQISKLLTEQTEFSLFIRLGALAALFDSLSKINLIIIRRQRRIVLFSSINIVTTITYTFLALGLVLWFDSGLMGIFAAQVIANFLKLVIGLIVNRKLLTKALSIEYLKLALKYSVPLFPATFVTWANDQLNRLIILYFLGLYGVGIFSAGVKISLLVVLFTEIFQMAWGPFSMEILAIKKRDEIYQKTLRYYLGFFLIMGLVLISVSSNIVTILVPQEYYESYKIIPWIIGAKIIHYGGAIINLGTTVTGKTIANSISEWTGLIVNICISLILVQYIGVIGPAIALFVGQLISKSILWIRSERLLQIKFDKSFAIKSIGIYVVTSIIIVVISNRMGATNWDSIILRFIILLIAVIVITKISIDDYLLEILNKIKGLFIKRGDN